MAKVKPPLFVVCGCGIEQGKPVFWALDTSDTRLFVVPDNLRVDVVFDRLYDFIGKDVGEDVIFRPTYINRRCGQILQYISKRREKYAAELEEEA